MPTHFELIHQLGKDFWIFCLVLLVCAAVSYKLIILNTAALVKSVSVPVALEWVLGLLLGDFKSWRCKYVDWIFFCAWVFVIFYCNLMILTWLASVRLVWSRRISSILIQSETDFIIGYRFLNCILLQEAVVIIIIYLVLAQLNWAAYELKLWLVLRWFTRWYFKHTYFNVKLDLTSGLFFQTYCLLDKFLNLELRLCKFDLFILINFKWILLFFIS